MLTRCCCSESRSASFNPLISETLKKKEMLLHKNNVTVQLFYKIYEKSTPKQVRYLEKNSKTFQLYNVQVRNYDMC